MESMDKFTDGHVKTAAHVRHNWAISSQNSCTENVQRIFIEPRKSFFDEEFIDQIKNNINSNSLASLKAKIIEPAKAQSPVS